MPGLDEICLSGVEIEMATCIMCGVYHFSFSKSVIQSLLTGIIGNRIGTYSFKAITKMFSWVPLFGNAVNAAVAGGTTAALGTAIIELCEDMDKKRIQGNALDDFINRVRNGKNNN